MPSQDHFALVSYVPDPLASFLYEMRRSLGGGPCPQPHITILPPRPLRVSSEQACRNAQKTLQAQSPFQVELSRVCCFADTNTLYLAISEGAPEISALHGSLNHGDLQHEEEYGFRPHLTIAGPVNPLHLPATLRQAEILWGAASCCHSFLLSQITCLLQAGNHGGDDWRRLWSVELNAVPPPS